MFRRDIIFNLTPNCVRPHEVHTYSLNLNKLNETLSL